MSRIAHFKIQIYCKDVIQDCLALFIPGIPHFEFPPPSLTFPFRRVNPLLTLPSLISLRFVYSLPDKRPVRTLSNSVSTSGSRFPFFDNQERIAESVHRRLFFCYELFFFECTSPAPPF